MDSYTPSDNVDEQWAADADGTGAIACYRTGTELIMAGNGSGSIKANTDYHTYFPIRVFYQDFAVSKK